MPIAEKWLVYALLATLSWGLWGVLLKIASNGLDWKQLYFFSGVATTIAITLFLAIYGPSEIMPRSGFKPAAIALGAGMLGTLGYLALANSLERGGDASTVVAVTALYPAVTFIVAAIALREEVTAARIIGVTLAVIAIVLLSK